jgi:hypothetical protein
VEDSNLRSRKTADLQSAPFGRSGNCPSFKISIFKFQISKIENPIREIPNPKLITQTFWILEFAFWNFHPEPLAGIEPATY